VYLGARLLPQVAWVNATTLTALAPWGMDAGVYNLRVVNPDGGEATLQAVFEVTQAVGRWNASAMDGGPVRAVLAVPKTTGLLYAYSLVTSAIYRSTDSGAHWKTVGHAAGQLFKNDPAQSNVLYLDAQQSTDGGVTWRLMLEDGLWPGTNTHPGWYIQAFPDPAKPGTLYLAAADIPAGGGGASGLLRSSDSGKTWQAFETGLLPGDTHVTAMEFFGDTIYLGTRGGNLYRLGSAGVSWQRLGSSSVLPSIGVIRVNPFEPGEMWVTTHFAVTASARIITIDLTDPGFAASNVSGWNTSSYPRTLDFLAADTALIGSHWDNGWITEDDGEHWSLFQPSAGKPGYWLQPDPWDSAHNTFYIADEQYGVQKTTDRGATWAPANLGLHAMSPGSLEMDPQNPARVYAKIAENGWPGIFVSEDGGQHWDFSSLEPASDGIRPVTSMLASGAGRIFAGAHGNEPLGYGPQVYISENQGSTWRRVSIAPMPSMATSFHMPFMLKADPLRPDVLLMTVIVGNRDLTPDQYVSEIYRSINRGESWQRMNLAGQVGRPLHNVGRLAFDPRDSNTVYASGDHEIIKSTDNGRTWSVILAGGAAVVDGPIAVEPVAPFRVYVGNRVSRDGGATWASANLPIHSDQLVFVPGSSSLYAAGEGLVSSNDGGTTWQAPEGPLAYARINALLVGRNGDRTIIYVGTPGGENAQANIISGASLSAAAPASLEAGVYRLTAVKYRTFIPLLRR
jgi:photosystem II stability/assembly factor-like uncharacterized protein